MVTTKKPILYIPLDMKFDILRDEDVKSDIVAFKTIKTEEYIEGEKTIVFKVIKSYKKDDPDVFLMGLFHKVTVGEVKNYRIIFEGP